MCEKSYDLHLLFSISRGNNEVVLKFIRLFLRNTPRLLRQLEIAYLAKDLQRFKELVNEIRPSFGYLRIRKVESDLELAERLAYVNFSGKTMDTLITRIILNTKSVLQKLEMEVEMRQIFGKAANHA